MHIIVFVLIATFALQLNAHESTYKHFIGSTFLLLGNLDEGKKNPDFIQLNLGYRITAKDVVFLEPSFWV